MKISVLDHGYVEFIEAWGHGKQEIFDMSQTGHDMERGIIEAARQSTQGSFRGWEAAECTCGAPASLGGHGAECARVKSPGDAKLLKFLYSHRHFTPFEFAGMIIEVQAPIFVFREWHRHRTQSYNEMSARYAPLPDLYYQPTPEMIVERSAAATKTRQAQGYMDYQCGPAGAEDWVNGLKALYEQAERMYQLGLTWGVPKELARLVMPVGHYSRMRASANLRNWLAFMTLRCAPEAQWEIQQFAGAVAILIEKSFPQTYTLWKNTKEWTP